MTLEELREWVAYRLTRDGGARDGFRLESGRAHVGGVLRPAIVVHWQDGDTFRLILDRADGEELEA